MASYVAFDYLPPKRRRSEEDLRVAMPPRMPFAEATLKVQDGLIDKYKLAEAKEFHIEVNVNGQMLGCGVEVRKFPDNSRFRIRIYDRDRKNAGKLRNYIELSLDDYLMIKRHEGTIRHYLNYAYQEQTIVRHEDFVATIDPPNRATGRPALKLSKLGSRIYMYVEAFANMMSYEETLRNEYTKCQRRNDEERQFVDDLANIVAFRRNEGKVNDFAKNVAEWFEGGTVTTWDKFVEQAEKSRERVRKRTRTSDKTTRG